MKFSRFGFIVGINGELEFRWGWRLSLRREKGLGSEVIMRVSCINVRKVFFVYGLGIIKSKGTIRVLCVFDFFVLRLKGNDVEKGEDIKVVG